MVVVKLRCNKCGHERLLTTKWLEEARVSFSPSTSDTLYNKIAKLLPKFVCSKCQTKGARFIHKFIKIGNKKDKFKSYVENVLKKKTFPRSGWQSPRSSDTVFPKAIPGYTTNISFFSQTQHKQDSGDKWGKKTCYYCNGTGANGNCFHCGGTGWE